MNVAPEVEAWHEDEGCHRHEHSSVAEGVCCVCDAEDPCPGALEETVAWVVWTETEHKEEDPPKDEPSSPRTHA